jgi:hypothetical protein
LDFEEKETQMMAQMAELRISNFDLETKLKEMLENEKYDAISNQIKSDIELERVNKL